ncbi:GNAT family N-acetyltransferase [Alkaliphilus serpentinus]|uniref:GNAT family N-acetyltransferase n=1 Tax=Alkaliphilus serpentinus TaxID=1482731 RepID=A0A833HM62_9FIRM|nr:GNAT family N-acetyltransferase [Alkaliphilus serpentinus]KAB3525748.1 GNAT family N-acetyltransferase [Alkaliphilus serpentinus]
MKYYLRDISIEDKEFIYCTKKSSIYDFVKKTWGWDEAYQMRDFHSDFNLTDFKIIALNKKDIGFIQTNESEIMINIIEIHVIQEYQGHGIGSSIIKSIIEQAAKDNKTITIGCFKDNLRAKELYTKLGFKVIATTDTHFNMEYSLMNK